MYVYIFIYVYIYIERERERLKYPYIYFCYFSLSLSLSLSFSLSLHIYIYIYIYTLLALYIPRKCFISSTVGRGHHALIFPTYLRNRIIDHTHMFKVYIVQAINEIIRCAQSRQYHQSCHVHLI